VAETVQPLDLLFCVSPHVAVVRKLRDELAYASSELVGEVGGRRADEGVDVVAGRLALHGGK
jgi:hypothetical protein